MAIKQVINKIKNNRITTMIQVILQNLYHYSGAKYIANMFIPKQERTLPTGPLWLIGIYVALFGLASQRFENKVDLIETKTTSVLSLMGTNSRSVAFSQFAKLQQMRCPVKPTLFDPQSIFSSLFGKEVIHQETVDTLKDIIEAMKMDMDNTNLSDTDLRNCDLSGANLSNSNLSNADLTGAILKGANLLGANLTNCILKDTDLRQSTLTGVTGLRTESFNFIKTNIQTKFPLTTEIPTNVELLGFLKNLEDKYVRTLPRLLFKGRRNHHIEFSRPLSEGSDIDIDVDGVDSHGLEYYDEDVWGTSIEFSVSVPHTVKIYGPGLEEEYYAGLEWGFGDEDSALYYNDWNYADTFLNSKYLKKGELGSEIFEEDYLLIQPIYHVLESSSKNITLNIERMPGEYIGVELESLGDDTEQCVKESSDMIKMFANAKDSEVRNICEIGAFVLMNVPDLRMKQVIDVLHNTYGASVFTEDSFFNYLGGIWGWSTIDGRVSDLDKVLLKKM